MGIFFVFFWLALNVQRPYRFLFVKCDSSVHFSRMLFKIQFKWRRNGRQLAACIYTYFFLSLFDCVAVAVAISYHVKIFSFFRHHLNICQLDWNDMVWLCYNILHWLQTFRANNNSKLRGVFEEFQGHHFVIIIISFLHQFPKMLDMQMFCHFF